MKKTHCFLNTTRLGCLAAWLAWAAPSQADLLINLPFNEGSGLTATDTASWLVGTMVGTPLDPAVDTVTLIDASPSGLPGDRSITNTGRGFLLADDSAQRVLEITNGPITIETWIFIDPMTPAKSAEGIIGYGGSYKLGMKGGRQVFTLFGKSDITNLTAYVDAGRWVHLAAAWEPGQGVHFYLDGVHEFVANTNETARPLQSTYLAIAAEALAANPNNTLAALDRVRIHHALLPVGDLDSDALNPKAPLASTLVAYNFNEAALPCLNALSPSLPAGLATDTYNTRYPVPVWTNDTPTGLAGDYALAFLAENALVKESVSMNFGSTPINLGANNTNYTLQAWVKLPTDPMEERRVVYRTAGPAPRVTLSINSTRTLHTTLAGNTDFTSLVAIPNDNRWHHVAAVMEDFARVHFYLDGVLRQTVNRVNTGAPSSSGTANLLIGKESDTRYFRGVLDRVLIHNHALTGSELDYPAIPGLATFPALASHPADTNVNLGDSVVFTAAPSSPTPATYQWHYRANLADAHTVAVPGGTSTTLTIENVGVEDLGYYSLVVTNEAGVAESYAARLGLIPDLSNKPFDFEPPTYTSGILEGQDHWTNDQNGNAVRVLTAAEIEAALTAVGLTPGETVRSGSQALLISGGGVATATIRAITGLENEPKVTLDVWVRPLVAGNTAMITNNTFLTLEDSTAPTPIRAAAFRFGPSLRIDYNSANAWVATGQTWDPTGSTWYRITMVLDYTAKTYDFLLNGTKVNANPLPFYFNTSDSFRQIRIYRGANQAGMIMDDLTVTATPTPPELGIRKEGTSLVIFWPASVSGYVLKSANAVNATPETWTTVPHTTVGDEHQAVIAPAENSQFFRLVK